MIYVLASHIGDYCFQFFCNAFDSYHLFKNPLQPIMRLLVQSRKIRMKIPRQSQQIELHGMMIFQVLPV